MTVPRNPDRRYLKCGPSKDKTGQLVSAVGCLPCYQVLPEEVGKVLGRSALGRCWIFLLTLLDVLQFRMKWLMGLALEGPRSGSPLALLMKTFNALLVKGRSRVAYQAGGQSFKLPSIRRWSPCAESHNLARAARKGETVRVIEKAGCQPEGAVAKSRNPTRAKGSTIRVM